MSNAISPQLLTSHKLYFEFTSQTQSIAHASSRLFSGRIPELEWAAEIEPNTNGNDGWVNYDHDFFVLCGRHFWQKTSSFTFTLE